MFFDKRNLDAGSALLFNDNALLCAAIIFADHDVLGHNEQLAGQIASLGGVQCRVSQTLAHTVSSDESIRSESSLPLNMKE
jgi:hypothetical protein